MRKLVINLDRSADRMDVFRRRNGHVADVERFPAVDGRTLSNADLVARGLVAADHDYAMNAVGSAMSHMALWEIAATEDRPVCIIEDDAILSSSFDLHLGRLSRTRSTWDYVAWGWNFDAPLFVELLPGISPARIQASEPQLRQNIGKYQAMKAEPAFSRLIGHYGILCYSVSPRGARRLLQACRPLARGASTLDHVMNGVYPTLQAFVAIPPMAVSENDHATSTNLHP